MSIWAIPLYWFNWLISPLITLGDGIAKGTLKLLERGDLFDERRNEVLNALDIDQLSLSEIMVPTDEVIALPTEPTVEENIERVRNTPHTRFPLIGETRTGFHGIVYTPSIIDHFEALKAGGLSFSEIAAPPMTVAADTTVSDAFDQFQAEDQELALVLQDGEVVGLLTATDALEAVMGELKDPLDQGSTT